MLSDGHETARLQQSRAGELRAAMSLARLRHRQGRHVEAQTALAPVYAMYTEEGFTMPGFVESRALLEQAMNS